MGENRHADEMPAPTSQLELVEVLTHDVISDLAPHELPLFGPVSERIRRSPRLLEDAKARDEMLGFGGGDVIEFLTPVVWAVTSGVVSFLAQTVMKSVKGESEAVITEFVAKLFRRFRGPDDSETEPVAQFTPEQLARLREVALMKTRQFKLGKDQAEHLVDSIVARMALQSA